MQGKERGAGRPGALDEARELVTLVSSLSEAGDSLDALGVAQRLGTSVERAQKLLALVLSATAGDEVGLPLVEEGGSLTLVGAGGLRGRRLRLGPDETLAVAAALERLGVPEEDPLRACIEESLSAEPLDESLVRRLMAGSEGTGELARALRAVGSALAEARSLSFRYQKPAAEPEPRRVAPAHLRCEDGTWYLDGFDLDRHGERTFRMDRMSDVLVEGRASLVGDASRGEKTCRMVRLTFEDASILDLLAWHDLRVVSEPGVEPVVAETPYYGGMWLPRMVAACGGAVRCDDQEVTALAREYARQQLAASRA